jgi:hypothetical protein
VTGITGSGRLLITGSFRSLPKRTHLHEELHRPWDARQRRSTLKRPSLTSVLPRQIRDMGISDEGRERENRENPVPRSLISLKATCARCCNEARMENDCVQVLKRRIETYRDLLRQGVMGDEARRLLNLILELEAELAQVAGQEG